MTSEMQILNHKDVNKGVLICTFTLKIPKWGNFFLREMALFQSNGKRWIGFPSKPYEVEGKKKYFSYAGFEERPTSDAFQGQVMKVLDAYLAKQAKQPEPSGASFQDDDVPF